MIALVAVLARGFAIIFKCSCRLLLVVSLITGSLRAADNPFVGKWKLNGSRSRLPDGMKVKKVSANKYAFAFEGGGYAETIVADGTDQPGVFGTTFSVTVEGLNSWRVVRKTDGKILITPNWKLSHDGNTLDDDFTMIQPDGSKFNVYYVYKRTAGGPGFAGTWESTSEKVNSVLELLWPCLLQLNSSQNQVCRECAVLVKLLRDKFPLCNNESDSSARARFVCKLLIYRHCCEVGLE